MSKPEEKVDDPQKETQVKPEEAKKEEVKLPEKKFFTGDKMQKWAEESGLFKEEEKPAEKPPEKKAGEKEEKKPEEKPEEKPAPAKDGKPFKVLTYKGKEVKIMTEEDYNKLASEGLDYTQKSQFVANRERVITEREDDFKRLSAPLETVAKAIESGDLAPLKTEEQKTEEEGIDKIMNNEEIDPELRAAFKTQNDEIKALRAEQNDSKKVEQQRIEAQKEARLGQAKVQVEGMVIKSQEEHPHDQIKEGERNITEDLFTGMVISKANADLISANKDPAFQKRNMQELVTETAQDLKRVQDHYKQKYSISDEKEPVTSAKLRELYPDQIKEIEQDRVASYHEEQEKGAPIAKSVEEGETKPPVEKKKEKQFTGVKDALSQAFDDPVLAKALKEDGDKRLQSLNK
ncbi:MAG: hypothetical protein KAW52_00175 [candidate division Zixibacteria bacterium]|nr:hypothetical protein [candidate division Zixibacteria bacterium]